ncbi:NPCBM-associated, NEW3 domain of alpha-galactosidase [uncultured archaeon]|nr:NPCBM-associated, NEW3 domain of alpha-galactosidase [uncultured archaeon]
MNKQAKILISVLFVLVFTLGLTSAMAVKSVDAVNFQPGSEQDITIKIKNTLDFNAEDVSLNLDMSKVPFTVINSEDVSEIESDDTESLDFAIKTSNDAKAGDYTIPYTLTYSNSSGDSQSPITGVFSLTVEANPNLVYSLSTETPIIGSQGKITLNIVNKGFGDAKFVSVTIIPQGYTLLSDDNAYIGTINSDDSETTSFDVIFNEQTPTLTAQIEYRDFNNKLTTKTINLPVTVYSQEQALKLGLTKKNNTIGYVIVLGLIFVAWMIVKKVRKKKRLNKAQGR